MEKGSKIAIITSVITSLTSAIAAMWSYLRKTDIGGLYIIIGGFVSLTDVSYLIHAIYALLIAWIYYVLNKK